MNPIFTDIIGYTAAFFGTVLMLPQVYKSYTTRQVTDLSIVMVIVYLLNCSSWEIYGLLIHSNPIIVCNFIAGIIGVAQLIMKLKFGNKHSA